MACSGRPGPVLVDIPKDVTANSCAYEYPDAVDMRSYRPTVKGHPGQIKRAIKLMLKARKPMIYTGGGVVLSNADAELIEFTRLLGFPITNTLMGPWRVSGDGPAVYRHAGNARHLRSQYGHAPVRRIDCHRCAFR